jgi:hypothetical protein
MFGLFKSAPFVDPTLGEFKRNGGAWRGTITLPGQPTVPLVLAGSRDAPEAQALNVARTLSAQFGSWRPVIAAALVEHSEPYLSADNAASDDDDDRSSSNANLPRAPMDATQVWSHVTPVFVSVMPLGGPLTVELGYTTDWDEEHTLGARFRDGRWFELCGSVVAP